MAAVHRPTPKMTELPTHSPRSVVASVGHVCRRGASSGCHPATVLLAAWLRQGLPEPALALVLTKHWTFTDHAEAAENAAWYEEPLYFPAA